MLCSRPRAPKRTSNPKPFPASQQHRLLVAPPLPSYLPADFVLRCCSLLISHCLRYSWTCPILSSACTARPGPRAARASLRHLAMEAYEDPIQEEECPRLGVVRPRTQPKGNHETAGPNHRGI